MVGLLLAANYGCAYATNQSGTLNQIAEVESKALPPVKTARHNAKSITPQSTGAQSTITGQNVSYRKLPDGLATQAAQASIPQILKAITAQSGIVIHYSALPDTLISAHCEGKLFSQVLECLIGAKVNMAYRYPKLTSAKAKLPVPARTQPEEIWVLGIDRADGHYATMACTLDSKASKTDEATKTKPPDSHKILLQMTGLEDEQFSDLRKQAISLLAAQGKTGDSEKDDATVAALHDAFKDKDPEVKAQAVFGLANQDVPERAQVLEEAVSDNNPDVRLMAVDSANADNPADRAILQQALQDRDETVKAAASDKLGIEYIEPGR